MAERNEAGDDSELVAEKESVIEKLKRGGWVAVEGMEDASEELLGDKAFVLEALTLYDETLEYASEELRGDREVVLEAVRQHEQGLQSASKELRSDKGVVLVAVKQHGAALRYASKALQEDLEVVLEAVKQNGLALEFASESLQAERAVALVSVRQSGEALRFASNALRADYDFAAEAVKECAIAWTWADQHLLEEQDILLLAARCLSGLDERYAFPEEYKAILARGVSEGSIKSPIAVRGQEAPILSIIMTFTSASNIHECEEEGADATPIFQCDVSLLSGASFTLCIADRPSTDQRGTVRPSPILDDLATQILEELPLMTKVENTERIFISFRLNEDGDAIAVTPWEWDQPLAEYLFRNSLERP